MVELRGIQSQSAVNQQLARGRLQEVGSAHDLGNFHRFIVYNHGKLISRNIVSSPDHKVSEVAARNKTLPSQMLVIKRDLLAIGHAKAPIHTSRIFKTECVIAISTISWIDRLVIGIVGSAG